MSIQALVFAVALVQTSTSGSTTETENADTLPAVRGVRTPAAIRDAILTKLDYDRSYFLRVQRLHARRKLPEGITAEVFAQEVKRARAYLPVLQAIDAQTPAFRKGAPFEQPGATELYRVYDNLVGLLNMVQNIAKGEYELVLAYGERISIRTVRDLGLRRQGEPKYRLQLLREYFYMMGSASFRMGRDDDAVKWFERIDSDPDLRALRDLVDEPDLSPEEKRLRRLSGVRLSSIGVMPFENVGQDASLEWVERGMMEVLSSDLVRFTDLSIVERSQLEKVIGEYQLQYVLDGENDQLEKIESLLGAGSLLVGSFRRASEGTVELNIRLVDLSTGIILAVGTGAAPEDDLFSKAREVLIGLLESIGWVDAIAVTELRTARVPERTVIRDLVNARKLLSTEEAEARRLYAKALRSDPTYAALFEELKQEFPEESARVAILPFVNLDETSQDAWLVEAIQESLQTDLPTLGFRIVERAQIDQVLKEYFTGTSTTTDDLQEGREIANRLRADFVVLGAVLDREGLLRIDARMVEVKSGEILFSATVTGKKDDLMNVLTSLSEGIARSANHSLSEEVMGELVGRKLSRSELEKRAREELERQHLRRRDAKEEKRKKDQAEKKEAELAALHVTLHVTVTPTTAAIRLNGREVGSGEVTVDDILGGHVRVRIEEDGYYPFEELRLFALGDYIAGGREPFEYAVNLVRIPNPISLGVAAGAWTTRRQATDGVGFGGEIFVDFFRWVQVGVGFAKPTAGYANLRVLFIGARYWDVGVFGHGAVYERTVSVRFTDEPKYAYAAGGGVTASASFPIGRLILGVRGEGGAVWNFDQSELAYPLFLSAFARFD
ncbi:MAG: FlgO family outer membrane protein [Deltaproteobacteria bacterium]